MSLLVDTGSAVTIVHERAWCPLQQSLQKVNRPVIAANGEPLSILGRTEIRIVIAGKEFLHQVLIARDITQECILGADFLITHGFVIDLGNRLLRIGETSTPGQLLLSFLFRRTQGTVLSEIGSFVERYC